MWVLLGTSWPKHTNMSIFCGVMSKNGRHQHTEQKKGIFMTLLRVNEYFVMRIVTKHNQRQEYCNEAALLNTYKSLQSCQRIK